jgi:hypothetical protein
LRRALSRYDPSPLACYPWLKIGVIPSRKIDFIRGPFTRSALGPLRNRARLAPPGKTPGSFFFFFLRRGGHRAGQRQPPPTTNIRALPITPSNVLPPGPSRPVLTEISLNGKVTRVYVYGENSLCLHRPALAPHSPPHNYTPCHSAPDPITSTTPTPTKPPQPAASVISKDHDDRAPIRIAPLQPSNRHSGQPSLLPYPTTPFNAHAYANSALSSPIPHMRRPGSLRHTQYPFS